MKKLVISFIMLVLVFSTMNVSASNLKEKDDFKADEIRIELKKLGVEENIINDLIDKAKRGEIWDSLSGEYSDLKPQIVRDGYTKTIYPDGSVSVTTINKPITPKIVTGGDWTSGSGYRAVKGALVKENNGVISMKFYADFEQHYTGTAIITKVRDPEITTAGLYSNETLKIYKGSRNPAKARLSAKVEIKGWFSTTAWLQLNVNGTKAWTTNN
ncbi:MAG: hypothetical protein ACTHVE_11630 [Senegalia sp. (in: firmicutes)]|uniref:hypothetical protein n=1 Tax=Senegalia sp. (in: firmicutes) TaxID=1924098 RepID=UPI003F9E8074